MKLAASSTAPRGVDCRPSSVPNRGLATTGRPQVPSGSPGPRVRSNVVRGPQTESALPPSKKIELQKIAMSALEAHNAWWEGGHTFAHATSPAELKEAVTSARPGQLVVVDYFAPHCAGCRSLHPKLKSISQGRPDCLFVQVNVTTPEMRSLCEGMGIHSIPWFQLFVSGELKASFTANLTTLSRLRREMATHSGAGAAPEASL